MGDAGIAGHLYALLRRYERLRNRFLIRSCIPVCKQQPCTSSMGAAVKDKMPPHQKLDAFAAMGAVQTTQKDMGRGATAGWVKCPLCPPRRMKRYARGRGLTAHLEAVHGSASLQEKTSAIAVAEAAPRTTDRRGEGFSASTEPPCAGPPPPGRWRSSSLGAMRCRARPPGAP